MIEPATQPLLDLDRSEVVVAAPEPGEGFWAGGPSALAVDGHYYLAYRLRRPVGEGRGYANVIARSDDGVRFDTVATVWSDDFDCDSLERPALVRRPDGGWRVYLSVATRNTLHWSVTAVDADTVEGLASGQRTLVWPGDERTAVKDPVVRVDAAGRWEAWLCCHPLPDAAEADRMTTRYATSSDGLTWNDGGLALAPTPGSWDQRGARLAAVIDGTDGQPDMALYDGRASAAENWYERTGLAISTGDGAFAASGAEPIESPFGQHALRYASAVPTPDGRLRVYFEAASAAGGNDLRTQVVDLADLRLLAAARGPAAG